MSPGEPDGVDDGATTDPGLEEEEEAFFQKPPLASTQQEILTAADDGLPGIRHDGDGQETTSSEATRPASAVETSEGLTRLW